MVNNQKAALIGKLTGVSITIGSITVELYCLVKQTTPYDLVVGRPSMKVKCATIDFDNDVGTFWHATEVTKVPLIAEYTYENVLLAEECTKDEDPDGAEAKTDDERDDTESSSI